MLIRLFINQLLENAAIVITNTRHRSLVKLGLDYDVLKEQFPRLSGNPMNLVYQCADGRWVCCTVFEYDRYGEKFFEALGIREEMDRLGVHDMGSLAGQAARAIPIFERSFARRTSDQWLKTFQELDIVCGLLNHFADVLEDEQAIANQYIQEYRCKNGEPRMITTAPVRLGSQGVPKIGAPVSFAEHNHVVLNQLGYSEENIAADCHMRPRLPFLRCSAVPVL